LSPLRGLGIALVVGGVVMVVCFDGAKVAGAQLTVVGLLLAVLLPWYLVRRAVNRVWLRCDTPARFAVSENGIQRTDAVTHFSFAWAWFGRVDVLPGLLLFSRDSIDLLPIFTSALGPGEQQQILALAAGAGVAVRGGAAVPESAQAG
jgi:hypothetical protein